MSLEQFFVFDETNFVNGQARLLIADLAATSPPGVPDGPDDIFGQISPYAPVTGWDDVGGTNAPPTYDRGVAASEWKVQQKLSAVLLVPQEITRTVKLPAAEFARADLLALFENADAPEAVGAASGSSAFEAVHFGQFTDFHQYRVALAAFMPREAGIVHEPGGGTRPRLVVQVFNRCSLAAENVTVSYGIGEMVSADVTLRLFPEPGAAQNQEHGCYFIEAAGTIA